jgi:hypothetical protein
MNPPVAPQGDFIQTLEPILLILGGAMTLGVGIFLVWLLRHTRAEDARTLREERSRNAAAHSTQPTDGGEP